MIKKILLISFLALTLLSCGILDKFTTTNEPQVIVVTATSESVTPVIVPTEMAKPAGETEVISDPINATLTLIAGPFSDSLIKQDNTHTASYCADVKVKNFKAEVTFTALPGFNTKKNSFALYFRDQDSNDQYRLGVRKDYWEFYNVRKSDWILVNTGSLVMTWGESSPNRLVVYAVDNTGYFYLNGYYIFKLDLTNRSEPGDVCVVTSEWQSDSYGQISKFEDFKVWELTPSQ
jgi:hypothetical protein